MGTHDEPTRTHEFGGPDWLRALCDLIEGSAATSGVDLTGVDWVSGERFTDVPPHLNPEGKADVGWTLIIRDGDVRAVPEPPPEDADHCATGDWEAIESLAHAKRGVDPALDDEMRARAVALREAGRIRHVSTRPRPEILNQAFGPQLFNQIIDMTTPPSP
jgi:hypothetical protein